MKKGSEEEKAGTMAVVGRTVESRGGEMAIKDPLKNPIRFS